MKPYTYEIFMQVPLGTKKGRLTLNKKTGPVTGVLSILGHEQTINGFIDTDGNCSFDGSIVTITRTINFHASGKLDGDTLELEIINDNNHYLLTGTEEKNEKNI